MGTITPWAIKLGLLGDLSPAKASDMEFNRVKMDSAEQALEYGIEPDIWRDVRMIRFETDAYTGTKREVGFSLSVAGLYTAGYWGEAHDLAMRTWYDFLEDTQEHEDLFYEVFKIAVYIDDWGIGPW